MSAGKPTSNLLDWFKDNIKRISTRALESIARIVYTIPLAEDWQTTASVASWTCPEGQYECFVLLPTATALLDLNSKGLAYHEQGGDVWFPSNFTALYVISNIDPATGDVSATTLWFLGKASKGWEVSAGEGFKVLAGTIQVRYRRIA